MDFCYCTIFILNLIKKEKKINFSINFYYINIYIKFNLNFKNYINLDFLMNLLMNLFLNFYSFIIKSQIIIFIQLINL